jgi:hypothetical protein
MLQLLYQMADIRWIPPDTRRDKNAFLPLNLPLINALTQEKRVVALDPLQLTAVEIEIINTNHMIDN